MKPCSFGGEEGDRAEDDCQSAGGDVNRQEHDQ